MPQASVSGRGLVRNHWYENDYPSANKSHFLHAASFWKWGFLEHGNGLFIATKSPHQVNERNKIANEQ